MSPTTRPYWQLPPGVDRGMWEYAQSPEIATQYDDYFALNSLFEFDQQVTARYFQPPGLVVDLGCGTGRALLPLVRRGHRGLAVDLSRHMLGIVREKARLEGLPVDCVQLNLVEMDALRDAFADYCMCMFSTLGMVRGRANRAKVLRSVRRILKPGGTFIVHAHNFWHNLLDPGGPWWVLGSLLMAAWRREFEVGDKHFPYRGIPNMFLHVFRRGELRRELRRAGFTSTRFIPLDTARRHSLPRPWLLGRIRANGWIVICQ